MRFVQLNASSERRLARVEEPKLRLLRDFYSLYVLAQAAITSGEKLTALAENHLSDVVLDYEQIDAGIADWKLLPPIVHIHFLGAHSLSFGQGVKLQNGDIMSIQFKGFGRPLRNPLIVSADKHTPVEVIPLA